MSCPCWKSRNLKHAFPKVLRTRGDIVYYTEGIYTSAPHQRAEWEPVDHAVPWTSSLQVGTSGVLVMVVEKNSIWLLLVFWDGFSVSFRSGPESGV